MTPITRWAAYCLMAVSLAVAVLLKGGVYPEQWTWIALGVSVAAALAVAASDRAPSDPWINGAMGLLLAWMILQVIPLPPSVVERLTPQHWQAVAAAQTATGHDPRAWVALSVAPSATFERLLDVVPAMAAFVAAREMAWWWQERMWVAVAPVIGIAFIESLVGLAQFYFTRVAGAATEAARGTYVNRNHFAGLLEMAFPIAVVLAISAWRKSAGQSNQAQFNPAQPGITAGPAFRIALLLVISACLLTGVVLSQSRMGFISTLAGTAFTMLIVPLSWVKTDEFGGRWRRAWRWIVPLALPILMLVLLPTRELVLRFADLASTEELSKDDRLGIWQDTLHFINAYKWTGCGLGAYEHGFYRYKTTDPVNTVDFAHNDYLQVLAELGIPGAAMAAILAGWVVSRTLGVVLWRRGARNWELAVGLFASLVTIGLHSLADFNLYIPANALAFAWLSGVAVSPGLRRN